LNNDRLQGPRRLLVSRARTLLVSLASLLLTAATGLAHASAGCTGFSGNFQAQNFGYHGTFTTSGGFFVGDKIVVTVNNPGNAGASYALDDNTTSTTLLGPTIASGSYTFPLSTTDTITVNVNNTGGTLDISWTCIPSPFPATVTVVAGAPNPSAFGQPFVATATVGGGSSPTGTVTFTVDGSGANTVPLSGGSASFSTSSLGVGTHTIVAMYSGDGGNLPSSGSYTQTVNQATQTITFPALASTPFTSAPPAPAATASSGLAVSYSSGTPGVCTVTSGGTIAFVSAGTCTIRADQAGNANYTAASQVSQSFSVTPGANVITFPALASTPFTSAPPAPAATASSGLAVSYSSGTPGVCTVTSGGTITFVSVGTCTIQADQAGDANYAAASQVSQSFVVAASNSITGTSPTGTGTITAGLTGGGPTCTFARARFIPLTGDPASPPAGTAPAGIVFPQGLFDFATTGCTPGSTLTFTITYPVALPGAQYWKYGPTAADPAPHWYLLNATISGNTATFSITDGGLGDDDLAADGAIVDQGGPGVPPRAVPTLSGWSTILLSGLFALLGMAALRRRGATARG
jgi:hypothetical protein